MNHEIERIHTQDAAGGELILEGLLDLAVLLALQVLLHNLFAALLGQHVVLVLLLGVLGVTLASQGQHVVSLVPLAEGRGIDDHDAVLHQGLGSHQLVVGGVVHNIGDTGLARHSLGGPGEVSGFQAQTTELGVSTTGAHLVHAAGAKLKK